MCAVVPWIWGLFPAHTPHVQLGSPAALAHSRIRCKTRAHITKRSCISSNPSIFLLRITCWPACLMNEKNIWSHNCSCGLHRAELRQLFTAKCARTMLLSVLLLEFSISLPKCVKTKIIQVFTLLYWLFQSDVHQCLHNYLSEIIQQTPFKLQNCTSGWAVHIICTVKNNVEGSMDLC